MCISYKERHRVIMFRNNEKQIKQCCDPVNFSIASFKRFRDNVMINKS